MTSTTTQARQYSGFTGASQYRRTTCVASGTLRPLAAVDRISSRRGLSTSRSRSCTDDRTRHAASKSTELNRGNVPAQARRTWRSDAVQHADDQTAHKSSPAHCRSPAAALVQYTPPAHCRQTCPLHCFTSSKADQCRVCCCRATAKQTRRASRTMPGSSPEKAPHSQD
jgi:hypothetical protein